MSQRGLVIEAMMEGKGVDFVVDTGAAISFINEVVKGTMQAMQ